MSQTIHTRALRRAAEVAGSVEELGKLLNVPLADLAKWMHGMEEPPLAVFRAAVDIALGEHKPERRG